MSQPPLTAFNCGTTSTAAVTLGLRQQICGPLVARQVSDISPLIPETTTRTRQLALHLEAKLDGVLIVSETGFTGAENRAHNDYDGTSAGVLLGVCGTVCVPAGPYTRLVRSNFVSIGLERVRIFSQ